MGKMRTIKYSQTFDTNVVERINNHLAELVWWWQGLTDEDIFNDLELGFDEEVVEAYHC